MKKDLKIIFIMLILIVLTISSILKAQNNTSNIEGAINPIEALEYMKNNAGKIIIIDTATEREYNIKHFEGAINIHYSEMPYRYNEIPKGSKVILHCRLGMVVPNAYKVLKEKRKDLQSIVYIDGAPLFDEYNNWIKNNK